MNCDFDYSANLIKQALGRLEENNSGSALWRLIDAAGNLMRNCDAARNCGEENNKSHTTGLGFELRDTLNNEDD